MLDERNVWRGVPNIEALAALCARNDRIDAPLYKEYDVKRGLRDLNGEGVLAGLTNISDIVSKKMVDGKLVPCEGELYYRGVPIKDLVSGFVKDGRKGYEEVAYLLLFGELPDAKRLSAFKNLLAQGRTLPTNFTRDVIMKAPTRDMMNSLSRSVLTLASYDDRADDISLPNVLRQSLMLISVFPMLAVYSYHAYNHYECGGSMYIHYPSDSLSTASNLLRMLRPDMKYTPLEASVLDLALVLHMEHGGGNNSSFTTHVVTSSGTDTYSAISAALGSLKGPKHGGANYKVVQMFDDLKRQVSDPKDDAAVADYLTRLVRREVFDQKGLIYGMGHAVYSISDPRAQVFKSFVGQLAREKGRDDEFALYSAVARLAPQVIARERQIYKGVSANVDFYSGFVYSMLGLPPELYTPVFAIARIVGWCAHRLEELVNTDKIIRPAYRCVQPAVGYVALKDR
ncbi:MAG: citrate/2-methylcitrate synthase [Eubacteriales bacterium]|nr:citrate/2-methylcitrate synthase [Eubacteriales bacterium]